MMQQKKGGNLAAWSMVQRPKKKGGLGVLNLRLQNGALLLKQLHKFYNKSDIPWVHLIWNRYYNTKVPHACAEVGSFWWKDILRLNVLYRGIAKCTIGDGSTVTFWGDLWTSDILSIKFPSLFSFALNPDISVKDIVLAEGLDTIFQLPLSQPAFDELLELQTQLQSYTFQTDSADSWSLLWGNQVYSSRRYYNLLFQNFQASPIFTKLWKSKCTPRLKFFAWLLFVDRLNSRQMLLRRHFNVQPNSFVLCMTNSVEDLDHLFFTCPFATACWSKLGYQWDMTQPLCARVLLELSRLRLPFCMEIFVFAAWEIWNLRNSKIFDDGVPTLRLWMKKVREQVYLQLVGVREDKRSTIIRWLESIT
jgi:hypothetical protein